MLSSLVAAFLVAVQALAAPVDVRHLQPGPPVVVTDLDMSRLKGDVRQLAWSPDQTLLYVQTAEGKPPQERVWHCTVALADGAITVLEGQPRWAVEYWSVKQDRVAPGIASLIIDVKQTQEKVSTNVGNPGVLDRQSSPDQVIGGGAPSLESLTNGNLGNQKANVWRLRLVGEVIGEWINERPIPGLRFSWGPAGSGALVYLGENGKLVLFDRGKHRQVVADVKDALLPAWSADGRRLAFFMKAGKNKYKLAWLPVSGW